MEDTQSMQIYSKNSFQKIENSVFQVKKHKKLDLKCKYNEFINLI